MTPEQGKAIEIFEKHETIMVRQNKWVTVSEIKKYAIYEIGVTIEIYMNAGNFRQDDNQQRINYWKQVRNEVMNLYK